MICASCGQENPPGFRFCGRCGAPLTEAPSDVRKTVSVVFCDLVGSTALGERTDPEVLREVMSRYHAQLRTILEAHGGTVEKFVGDAAMAVFGLPQVHEDDALRAVRAAVEMRDAVTPLGLEVRVGVNTGEVVAGTGETLVTGDAVNVAARLEQAAAAGEVLIGSATERLVRGAVRAESIEPLVLKGKSDAVPAFRVLELVHDLPAFTRAIATPFVGRQEELEQLDRALASAVEARSPQLTTIVGPPGIGKSRLARELLAHAQARVVVGRCLSYGEGITYWPLAEIASQIGDVRVALHGASDAELAALRIRVALGAAEATASPQEIAWGFRKLFEALALRRPLIVVFDDIHWAEPTLLDLIEYVAAFAHDIPLLILCTARTDLFDLRPAWTTPKPNATLLMLDPLPGADSEALVAELSYASAETQTRIVEAAEGNPLFVEQLVAMQAESGNGEVEVPPTLHALLAARIDRLAEQERAIIERGSVEGRLFHRGAVAELLPEPDRSDVGVHLITLVRKELIRPDRATLPGDDGFRFSHALIRDAAYEAIPKRQRAVLHERYAEWLASRLGDDAPDEIVGYHLEEAYRYGTELGTANPAVGDRAAERLAAAARAARMRQDVAATVNLLGRAVELVPVGALRRRLFAELGAALAQAGELARAHEALEEAAALARAAGDTHVEWLARVELAFLRVRREPEGAAEAALREGEAALAAREAESDHEVLAKAWGLIAEAHLLRSQALEQTRALERALQHAGQAGDLTLEVELVTRSAVPIIFGSVPVEEGVRYVDGVLEHLGDVPAVQAFALHVLGHLRARMGQFDGAREAMDEWRRRFRELGQDANYAVTAACVWDVCSWAEDWAGGEQALRESYDMLERMGEKSFLSTAASYLGEALYRQGRIDEAEAYSAISEKLGASDDRVNEAAWRILRAKTLSARGEFDRAEALAREAVEIAAETDYFELAAGTWLDLAEILRAAGNAEARTAAREALVLYERKGNVVGARRARAVVDAVATRP
ncbi:MAG TPA: AAA family ATPase [Gaiellaceae bacterium]|nr:AAA family ATPase [Gaiellaceae bacterium]